MMRGNDRVMMLATAIVLATGDWGLQAEEPAFVHSAVPAMSEFQRLPDVEPQDGVRGGAVRIVAARGEYEPGAFSVCAARDLGKVRFEVSDLKQVEKADGGGERETGAVFPKGDLDLRVVKVWYQNLNAWFSYFGDCGNKLCPELLLHDEDLIRVDEKKQANYARITRKDGSTYEHWINPPRKMDLLFGRDDEGPRVFQPMRLGFADAKTLQPVRLDKGVWRNFFLTACVKPGTPAGVYRGEVKVRGQGQERTVLGSIPVELRVLDWELPKYPRTYFDPEREYMTCNYGYFSVDLVMQENGGDPDLAKEQFKAICRNLVSHGQSLLKNRSDAWGEFEMTHRLICEAGMRQDVFVAGPRALRWKTKPSDREELERHASALARATDRLVGHHNFYLSHGDEPGQHWMLQNRVVFDAYQKAGFKFLIAGSDNVFHKGGHFYDWHNVAADPTDDRPTKLWNQMPDKPVVAWYSNMHVGPENPAFNRRQYGMAPYLAGYSGTCNYAHHLGPYNDDTTTYRPMVFAYGTADGVIDTIQWEGYREAIDDTRHATVLCELARRATATGDRRGRLLGGAAMMYLARFDRERGDLNECRAEMIVRTAELKGFLASKGMGMPSWPVPAVPVAAKADSAPAGADAAALHADLRYREELAVLLREGKYKEAVDLIVNERFDEKPLLTKLYRRILTEPAYTNSAIRQSAWIALYADGADDIRALRAAAVGTKRGAIFSFYREVAGRAIRGRAVREGRWAEVLRIFDLYDECRLWESKNPHSLDPQAVWNAAQAALALGQSAHAREILAKGLENKKLKPVQRAELTFAAAAFAAADGDPAAHLRKAAAEAGSGLTLAERVGMVERTGCLASVASDERLLRALVDLRTELGRIQPRRRYEVRYSAKPVTGAYGWDRLDPKPEIQLMDRRFGGGSLAFMETDVATGDRGKAAKSKDKMRPAAIQVVADAWGLHFRYEGFDERAKSIAAGLTDFGSFETYLAPGANTPYESILFRLRPDAQADFYHTSYDHAGYRRVRVGNPNDFRQEIVFTETGAVAYMGISWNVYGNRLPTEGSVWDFENIFWGPEKTAWNGTESIHGRGTWGELVFRLSEVERLGLLRRQVYAAVRRYRESEASERGREGAFSRWQDDELGDPDFYGKVLNPLREELDAAAKRVAVDMDETTVRELVAKYLPRWRDIDFTISRLRAEYLGEKLTR